MENIIALMIVVGCLYLLVKYIIPFIWYRILIPTGKAVYVALLFAGAMLLFIGFNIFMAVGIPQEVAIVVGVGTGGFAGWKWFQKKRGMY